jgi:hypothetical protein
VWGLPIGGEEDQKIKVKQNYEKYTSSALWVQHFLENGASDKKC